MDKPVRPYASRGAITSEALREYGKTDKDLHLKRVIASRLEEGWTLEEIIIKYGNTLGDMSYKF